MKKRITFGVFILLYLTSFYILKNSFAAEYEVLNDTIFTYPHDICIDPGHGGPTACKYGTGCNGDGAGAYGDYDSLSEQWINLQVAYKLQDRFWSFDCIGFQWQSVVMTRAGETDIPTPPEGWWRRIKRSRYANAGNPVYEFISIHHNGFPTPDAEQGTETFWCNLATTPDSGFSRDASSTLARKVRRKIHDIFDRYYECYECYRDRGTKLKCGNFVLARVVSPHVLTEASDITWHGDEEELFDDPEGMHAEIEAEGIYQGWCSYCRNAGFVTVKNHALSGEDGHLKITGASGFWTIYASPYQTVWGDGEFWRIDFYNYQCIGDDVDTFHHLKELETGYYSTSPVLEYTVPQCSTHTIIGYYKGGPYSVELCSPNSGEYTMGESLYIDWYSWNTSLGLDTTALIDAYLDRNGGGDGYPEKILSDIPVRFFGYQWQITGPPSESCKIKLISHDCVENYAEDVSDYYISIVAPDIPGDANSDGIIDLADVIYIAYYYFGKGPPPEPRWKGDTDGDCCITVGDAVHLASYLFEGGSEPWCNPDCPDWNCESRILKTEAISFEI